MSPLLAMAGGGACGDDGFASCSVEIGKAKRMIISFIWTIEPLLAGLKTCTRRAWADSYFQLWVRAWRESRHIHQVWDKSPRFALGER
jgi:hypothetical protein